MNPRDTHKKMSRLSCSPVQCLLRPLPLLFILSMMSQISQGDVGTAARYSPPYLHRIASKMFLLYCFGVATACYNDSASQFPSNNLFAAAGDGIWDNGAACGRQYLVRCISAAVADSCIADQVIQVKIVDYALALIRSPPSARGTTIVLSETAFAAIANTSAAPTSINLEFQQV
ncbi:EG45-LIKE DOMAIN CONTAINING PROTEIN [Salix purpurea]|uniref:EG45-LIKE DOMAIN CONTAINING PROTEIN n=1 Tax=Salix purpurea TaxID=77065 RepID=A0A9Q0Q324_SALPP|nr:EG45-LIKE DOMAIN CONTAINING PROTEIN [Salix purpurea]